jgi:hypothetical protein
MIGTLHLRWDEGKGIRARTFVYKTLLAGSALFTAGVGVKTQTNYDDFETVAYGKVQNDRVSAYTDIVSATEQIRTIPFRDIDPTKARELARRWISEHRAGKLTELTPVALEDSFDIPVKNEILEACSSLAIFMNQTATRGLQAGDPVGAAKDALQAIEVASVIKYSDFETVGSMSQIQKKSIQILDRALAQMPKESAQTLRRKFATIWITENSEPLGKLLAIRRTQYVDYARRTGNPVPPAEVSPVGEPLPNASPDVTIAALSHSLKLASIERTDEEFPTFLTSVNYAYRTEGMVQAEAHSLIGRNNGAV